MEFNGKNSFRIIIFYGKIFDLQTLRIGVCTQEFILSQIHLTAVRIQGKNLVRRTVHIAHALNKHRVVGLHRAVAQLVADGGGQRGAKLLGLRVRHGNAEAPHRSIGTHRHKAAEQQHDDHRAEHLRQSQAVLIPQFFHNPAPVLSWL